LNKNNKVNVQSQQVEREAHNNESNWK